MTDKVQKIREFLVGIAEADGVSTILANAIEKKILPYIDSLQKEPVSNDFEMALAEMIGNAQTSVIEPWVVAAQWKDELIKLAKSEEPVSEDLKEEIDNYVKRNGYDGLDSIEEVKYIANHFVKWKVEQFEKNRLKHCNSITNEQAELEQGFIDQHLDKHQRMPTFLDAIEYGMRLREQQMMAKAINTEASFNMSVPCICISLPLGVKVGDKVKVIVTKED